MIGEKNINTFFEELLKSDNITDISFNGKDIFVQDNKIGRYKIDHNYSLTDVENYIKQLTYSNNEQFNDENPILDTEYPNLRINAIHKSISPYGITTSLRSSKATLKIDRYNKEIAPQELFLFLEACIKAKLNIIISGITGSGKTELQKYLVGYIDNHEKIVMIEDTLDTHIKEIYPNKDIFSWQTNNKIDKNITFDDLIKASLRNNPDWIIISETRGSEAYSMLKSILSGHNIITTIHSNDCKGSIERIVHLCKENNNLDQYLLGNMASDLFDIGIHLNQELTSDGIKRMIVEVVEYCGYNNRGAVINKLFSRSNKVKKEYTNFQYEEEFEYGKVSKKLFDKLARKKVLSENVNIFLKEEYYER